MHFKFYFVKLFLIVLLLSMGIANKANAQLQVNILNVYNSTTGAYDSSASAGDILVYSFITTNTSNSNLTGCRFYNNIPAGTSYVTGSTSLNDIPVPDVNGKMPYVGSGGLINPIAWDPGILGAGTFAKVTYQVKVTANAGKISNYATCVATSSGVSVIKNSGILFTPLLSDPGSSTVYQSTANTASVASGPYNNIRTVSTENGTGGTTIFAGAGGPCYNAITGASLPAGSVLTNVAALAFDKNSNRIYFVNNVVGSAQDLCYVDLGASPVAAKRFVGYPLETATGSGYNINRMTFAVDGYGYAVTSNALDLIRFSINASTGLPVISRLGALVNDVINSPYNVLTEAGGDIFSDGSGKLYLVVNSGRMYRIDPATRVSTYLGTIHPVPSGSTNSVAIDTAGNIYIGGSSQNVYKVNLSTLSAASITGGTTNVWTNGDYTSGVFPVLQSAIQVNTSYRNTNGNANVAAGDTIEYTIEVVNTGNFPAAGLRLYDAIPAYSSYVAASTTMNGAAVADAAQLTMPFSLSGGKFISSPGESAGIIKTGDANKVVIKYRIITEPLKTICNQATATFQDVNGTMLTTYSDDPAQPGNQDATCFWSDSAGMTTPGARIAATGNTQLSAKGTVQPNPFVSALNLQLQLNTAAAVQVRLFDLYGRAVFTTSQKLAKGFQSLHINVPAGLTPGIYVLEITDGNNQLLQKKLLKQ
ncbi:MAG TPA: T9SS type A sorting domain-containing protein [Niastella sp.]